MPLLRIFTFALCIAIDGFAHARVIDDFSVGPASFVRGSSELVEAQTGLDPLHVIGGARSFSIGDAGNAGQRVDVDTSARTLTFATGSTSFAGYLTAEYGSEASPLDVDLTTDGANQLIVIFETTGVVGTSAFRPPGVSIGYEPTGFYRPLLFDPATLLNDGTWIAKAPFANNSHIDFSNVERISFGLSRFPTNATMVLHSISTEVPEPATVFMMASGVLTIASRRGRSRCSASNKHD